MQFTDNEGLFHSAKWALIANWYGRLIGIVNTLVLLKLLTPADFGVAALSTFFVSMFVAFSHVGVAHFVISSDDMTEQELDSIWTLGLVTKSITALCLYFSAEWIAQYVNNPAMSGVIQVVAIIPFLSGLRNVALDQAEKHYKFKLIIATTMVARTAGAIISIILAIYLQSYWALIIGVIASATVETIAGYVFFPRVPRLSCKYWRQQWGFSKWLYIGSIVGYLRSRIDVMLLGNISDARGVGLYSISTEFSWLPFNELIVPINRGFFSVASRNKNDSSEFYNRLIQQLTLNMLIVIPCAFGMMAISAPFTEVILGDEWLDATALIYTLSPLMIVMSVYGVLSTVLTIKKKMKLIISSDILFFSGIVTFFLSYQEAGIHFLAQGRLWIGLLFFSWLVLIFIFVVKMKASDMVLLFIPPLAASLVMYIFILWLIGLFNSSVIQLVIGIPIGIIIYTTLYLLSSYQCRAFYPYHWKCCDFVLNKMRKRHAYEGGT
ncbi:hypothetical protein C9J03_18290 [Photobacterium gaetbulicola]|uniref:Lipopolysaccharide biosynthesis protein n=1 Tax=Photobacterium gaetbulicola Gung47 TaxID=658445 RepID=A0A0C5WPJ8_9GAMM|nr:oligosaccharide flippase family protein [Photobacterium gaetbulicola]AJR09063.1 hypothetical protein H744_2c2400 [Photobacterium gaetbulicola Gung47]PSU04817.1 hypothetical protein C9J03_18290 [Photobacterium gaetbulicola]